MQSFTRFLINLGFNAGFVLPFLIHDLHGDTSLAWGTLLSVGVGLAGNYISGKGQQKAVENNNEANLEATKINNQANLDLFREARGSKGSAVLPLFFGSTEKNLANSLVDTFKQDQNRSTQYADQATGLNPALTAGNDLINKVQTGGIYDDRTAQAQLKASARKAAINDSLQETLKGLRESRYRSGFGGGSSFTNSLLQGATLDARVQEALAGLAEQEQLYNEDVNLRLNTLGLPLSRTEGLMNLDRLRGDSRYAPIDSLLQRLGFFNLGQGNPPTQQAYFSQVVPNDQQFLGSAISTAAGAYGNYRNNQQLIDAINKLNTATATPAPAAVPTPSQGVNFTFPEYDFLNFGKP